MYVYSIWFVYIYILEYVIYIYKYLNHDNRDFWQVQLAGVPVFPDSTRDSAKMKAAQKRGVIWWWLRGA